MNRSQTFAGARYRCTTCTVSKVSYLEESINVNTFSCTKAIVLYEHQASHTTISPTDPSPITLTR